MAKGLKCRCCGHYMYAQKEKREPKGTYVTYVCRNNDCKRCKGKCTHEEKVFEDK